ncbi:MAG: InlB B-repeat-containing protein, partial [Firmicutes bacterium]|nr:InlB B-repeat-containing protein [Bacillota bacterium]
MKEIKKLAVLAILVSLFTVALTACFGGNDVELNNGDPTIISKATVTFVSNGGSDVAKLTDVPIGSTIAKPADPAKAGCDFAGWFKDEALNYAWNFSADTVTSNIVLYAEWTESGDAVAAKYEVAFVGNGGSSTTKLTGVTSGSKITKPADPAKTGCDFAGWFKDEALNYAWNFGADTVTSNIVLYAKWTESGDAVAAKYEVAFVG